MFGSSACRCHALRRMGQRSLAVLLLGGVSLSGLAWPQVLDTSPAKFAGATSVYPANRAPVQGQVSISRDVPIVSDQQKVSLNMRNAPLTDVLNLLAEQGHFNLILDSSVQG